MKERNAVVMHSHINKNTYKLFYPLTSFFLLVNYVQIKVNIHL